MNITSILSIVIACGSLIFVAINYGTGRHDRSEDESVDTRKRLIEFEIKIDNMLSLMQEIRNDQKTYSAKLQEIDTEIALIKKDITQAFLQISELKGDDGK